MNRVSFRESQLTNRKSFQDENANDDVVSYGVAPASRTFTATETVSPVTIISIRGRDKSATLNKNQKQHQTDHTTDDHEAVERQKNSFECDMCTNEFGKSFQVTALQREESFRHLFTYCSSSTRFR